MLFKLKSVLYPPDATAINRRRYKITRFFLAVAYEHYITMKHFRFGYKIETSLNLFSLFISKRLQQQQQHFIHSCTAYIHLNMEKGTKLTYNY